MILGQMGKIPPTTPFSRQTNIHNHTTKSKFSQNIWPFFVRKARSWRNGLNLSLGKSSPRIIFIPYFSPQREVREVHFFIRGMLSTTESSPEPTAARCDTKRSQGYPSQVQCEGIIFTPYHSKPRCNDSPASELFCLGSTNDNRSNWSHEIISRWIPPDFSLKSLLRTAMAGDCADASSPS